MDVLYDFGKKGFKPIWELGYLDGSTGEEISSNAKKRTKNCFKCKSNAKYMLTAPVYSTWLDLFIYDYEKNFIKKEACHMMFQPLTVITPSNAKYIRFCVDNYDDINFRIEEI